MPQVWPYREKKRQKRKNRLGSRNLPSMSQHPLDKEETEGVPWWPSGYGLSVVTARAQVPSLVKKLPKGDGVKLVSREGRPRERGPEWSWKVGVGGEKKNVQVRK